MADHSLAEHVQAKLDELAYWESSPSWAGPPESTKLAEMDCRREIESAAELLRQHGFG